MGPNHNFVVRVFSVVVLIKKLSELAPPPPKQKIVPTQCTPFGQPLCMRM